MANIDLYNFYIPVVNLFRQWLTIEVSFANVTFPMWAVVCFILLLAIFVRVLASIGGIITHYVD